MAHFELASPAPLLDAGAMRTGLRFVQVALALAATSSIAADSQTSPMKAVVLRGYGGPEVAKLEEMARPEPKDDEILLRVIAASVNPVDVAIRKGYLAELIGNKFPLILGMDAAGVVEKAGPKITKFKKGDAVYAFFTLANEGGYAEYVIAKESEAALKPKGVSYAQAAAVPAAGSTAWLALIDTAKVSAGQTVLIHGASGGVGTSRFKLQKHVERR
jgi:NADPH:quinone reductase-like Zn-dependent oxidoreductase